MPDTQIDAFQTTGRDKVMGAIVLAAMMAVFYLTIVGTGMDGMGMGSNTFYTVLSKSYGISPGGVVSLSGVRVGSVQSVQLRADGKVRISLFLDPEHEQFYRVGSQLQIDSQLALGNVISGSGLIFVPGDEKAAPLAAGAELAAVEPQSLDDLLSEWNVQELVANINKIVKDMSEVIASVNDSQAQLIDTLTNSAEVSANMAEATELIPALVQDINELLVTVNTTIEELGGDASTISDEVVGVMQNTEELTASLNLLAESMAPTAEKSPILVDNLIQVSRETEVLLNKLNQHWLLGGAGVTQAPVETLDMPADDSLYQ